MITLFARHEREVDGVADAAEQPAGGRRGDGAGDASECSNFQICCLA